MEYFGSKDYNLVVEEVRDKYLQKYREWYIAAMKSQ